MTEGFSLLIFIVFMVGLAATIADNVRVRMINAQLRRDIAQGLLDLMAIRGELEEANKSSSEQKIEETEGFLKFVSQSRDWAFQYIERVQIAIKNFQDVFHPFAVQYYKDKDKPVNQKEFGKLFEAYRKLIKELPDEGKNN